MQAFRLDDVSALLALGSLAGCDPADGVRHLGEFGLRAGLELLECLVVLEGDRPFAGVGGQGFFGAVQVALDA